MLDLILRPAVITPLLCIFLLIIYRSFQRSPSPDLPCVGLRNERFAKIRCRWRSSINYRTAARDAYNLVSPELFS